MKSELPKGWEIKKLGDLLVISQSGIWGEEPTESKQGYPVIRSTEMTHDGELDLGTVALRFVPEDKIDKYKLTDGDILVVKSSGSHNLIGRCVLFKQPNDNKNYLFSNFTQRLSPNKLVDPKFLYYFLNSEGRRFVEYLQTTTTGLRNLPVKEYLEIEIILPPLPEQKRIVAKVEELFEKIDEAKKLREVAITERENLIPSALSEIFGRAEKEEWNKNEVGNVVKRIQYGLSAPIPQSIVDEERAVPILRMANITTDGQMDYSNVKFIEVHEKEFLKFRLNKDDVLFNWRNSKEYVGKTAVFSKEDRMIFASFLLRLEVNPEIIIPEFLSIVLNWLRQREFFLKACDQAVSQANFNASKLKEVEIIFPKLSAQHRIVKYLDSLQAQTERLKRLQSETQKELDDLKKSILDKAFKGEL